ncbi:zinc finger protein 831 isoform X1 [Pleuronectes platessa]|uniref:zinc finger protein 831 isoform X1 n=1 Tax=Pleuronectes platessa TaxID=8262 RepID=UPI00232A48A4|nr:zinc finger protein 831 isoform X1 [Pleuronectes platessa]
METGKPVCAPVHISSAAAQIEKRMDVQAPLTAVYIHTVPALPAQPFPQLPAAAREPATLHLAMPPLYSKENPCFLTLHIAGGLHSSPGLSPAAAAPTARPKSAGKHVCTHCGRDCMKPSVLEKHLRCHTGERPYPCTTCRVSFKTQSNLYKHKRTQAHARLSSESEQSSLGSQDSMSSSRETHSSSLSLDEHSEKTGIMEKDATLPVADITCTANTTEVFSVTTQGSICEQRDLDPASPKTDSNESAKVRKVEENLRVENEQSPSTIGRHLPLQRQKATVFSKQWERSVSRGKSQNHESTDSGFSESSDHYPSPGSVLHGHSLDSLSESNKEHFEETTNTHTSSEPDRGAREQEQKTLEERISKLISENTAVVEDKQLENVRPRKTVLSKQGSIDLPLPYTYKDSFHFDMKISRTQNVGLQRNRKPGLYSSVPTQQSTTMEHGPLTRSNSLPFSVTLLQPERSSSASSYQSNYESLICRGGSGQINQAGFAIKPVNQQSSTHRPLVRQTAVDCNHATDGLFMNSSVEEASTGSLSCDGDICGEPSNRKFRRKKAQKFAYDKWYMYGGGTFKKLYYNTEKDGDKSVVKGRKCMKAEHEAFQAPQKKLSSAHKETVTTGSAINIPSSRATVCHPGCSPAKTSLSSTVDVNVRTTQLHSACSSVKTPIRRNLSLSILPLPSVVSHQANSMSSTGAGLKEKHTDSISELCGAHIPSDRKKQRTADDSICQLEMETAQNTLSYLPPSVTGSALRQDAHFSYVNLQKKQKHTQLEGNLFSPCIINANAQSASTLPPTSLPSALKTSFLPKYQLKLPNAGEHDSNTSLHVVDKPTVTAGCTFTSPTSSSKTEQTSPSVTAPEIKLSEPVTVALMQTGDSKKTNALNSTQAQLFLPCTAATFCQAETSRFNENMTSSLPVVHRQFAATTITTACLHDYHEGLCSTLIQPSKSAPVQLPSPVAPAIPSISTENSQTSATSSTTIPQCPINSNLPLSHLQFLPKSEQSNFVNRAFTGPNTPKVPCHIIPFDQVQPAGQNVFHVHTADLQICLQIISDEQLALIEPQIERHEDSSLSQRRDMQAQAAKVIQNKAKSSAATERSNEGTDHRLQGYQKELDQNESSSTLNVERIKPPLTAHMTEHRNSRQATLSAESKPPEAPGLTLHPHKCSHLNTATETLSFASDVMSTAAVRSGRNQTSEEERALSLNSFPEEQPFLGSRASQGGLVLQTLSGLSPNSVNQNRKSELLVKDIHHKTKNQGASCEVSIMKTKWEASAYRSNRLESGETPCSMHVRCDKASSDELSGSLFPFSINNCKSPRKLNPHTSICCSKPSDPTISETVDPSKHENTGCDRVGPSDNSVTLPEKTLCDSQDVISLAHSQKLFTSESSNIHVERTKDIPAVLSSIQSPTAGILEGDCLGECEVQKEPQKWGHVGIPGQSDCTDRRPKLSQEARETTHQGIDGQSGGGVMREDKNGRIKADTVPGELANTESNCRYTALPDMTELEGQDTEVKVDSFKNPWLSEEHLQHLSQTHSGMSEYPLQRPQRALSTSNNLNLPASGSETSLLNSPQPPLEVNNLYLSQQHWESSIARTKQTQTLCESNSSKPIKTQAQFKETQNAVSQVTQQTTFLHQEKQTLSVQQGNTAGNNSTAVSHSTKVTLGSNKTSGLLADIKTSCATHHCQVSQSLQVSQASAGWTGNTQTSNTNMLGYNAEARLKPFTYQEPELDPEDQAPDEYITHSSNSGRTDTTSKYQSFFLAAQLQGYEPAESLTAGGKPVPSCQDSSEDTSSSDDEGKLIIEL